MRSHLKNLVILSAKIGILAFLLVQFTGCASVTRGTTDVLEVSTEPPGATVYVTRTDKDLTDKEMENNTVTDDIDMDDPETYRLTAKSPAAFKLSRKGKYFVEIEKEGYLPVEVNVTHKTSGQGGAGMAGNVLVGGAIGVVVDASTGATQDLTPNPIEVNLEAE